MFNEKDQHTHSPTFRQIYWEVAFPSRPTHSFRNSLKKADEGFAEEKSACLQSFSFVYYTVSFFTLVTRQRYKAVCPFG